MKKKLLLVVLLPALLLNTSTPAARAQAPQATPPAPKGDAEREAARAGLERKALGLLRVALEASRELRLAENRVRAQVAGARLLWPRDPEAARAAFKEAADGVAELNAAVNPEDQQFYVAAQGVMQLRGEMVQIAAQHDAKLALEFLRATRPPYAETLAAAGYGQQEQLIELTLAARIAAQEPKRALEMAEESLSRGVTSGLVNVLNELRAKDPAAAAKLAAAIVKRLRADDLPNNYETSGVAHQLLYMTRPSGNTTAGAAAPPAPPVVTGRGVVVSSGPANAITVDGVATPALLDEPTRRELVEKVLSALSNTTPNQVGAFNLFHAFQTLLPEIERYAPGRAAALRRRADELERGFNPQGRLLRPYEELMQTGTAEALLEAASKAPAEVRDQLYTNAAWKAFNEGKDPERARRILENVSNPQQRAQLRRDMEQQARLNTAQQGGYAEARQAAARLASADDRMTALMQIAAAAAAANDAQTARQVLEDARAVVEGQTRGQHQFQYRLQLADSYARFDAGAAFEQVELSIGRLDELMEAAVVLDGFGQEAFTDGELKPQTQGGHVWHDLINRCAQSLAALAVSDFERAGAAVGRFRRADARVAAQLSLAAAVLNVHARVQRRRQNELRALGGDGGR
ncbi:MAG TPA: hypothetical protein VF588_07885 [Pyrinomonadaceae bacterium]|jgi:hypothetical protein